MSSNIFANAERGVTAALAGHPDTLNMTPKNAAHELNRRPMRRVPSETDDIHIEASDRAGIQGARLRPFRLIDLKAAWHLR